MAAPGGRQQQPHIGRAGLAQEAGVELSDKGAIKVSEVSQTSVPNIWAIGDVTDRVALSE
jgi:glutathione reductase (NADPH)